jgi:ABC-type transporter Mla MlaB component
VGLQRKMPMPSGKERGRGVLKITMTESSDEQRWSLQGHLVGEWAAEFELTWRAARVAQDARKCIVELIEVTSIDRSGEAVLAEIMSHGGEFIASDVYTKHLLQNLRSELERSRVKEKQDAGGHRS